VADVQTGGERSGRGLPMSLFDRFSSEDLGESPYPALLALLHGLEEMVICGICILPLESLLRVSSL